MNKRLLLLAACPVFAALLLAGLVKILAAAHPTASFSTTITVDSTADDNTANGNCTLREAVLAANLDSAVDNCPAGSGADTIVLPPGVYTLALAPARDDAALSGDLDITGDLTLTGDSNRGSTIDGGSLDRVFQIQASARVTVMNVAIQNGYLGDTDAGAGIHNSGSLTLTNSTVQDNTGGAGVFGGGIYNLGTMMLQDSIVSGNIVSGTLGGNMSGGGIFNAGTAVLSASLVTGNTARHNGGGIFNQGSIWLHNSTVSGNHALATGGAIVNGGALTLTHSTVAFNTVAPGGTAGIQNNLPANPTNLKNTIVAANTGETFYTDCSGTLVSLGYNLIHEAAGCTLTGDTSGLITGQDPLLAPLADNGGPTRTHALLPRSPAIDAGSPDCPPPAADQRGVQRPFGLACDIGAYEAEILQTFIPVAVFGD